ncbi:MULTISPECIES: hypothetical protein [unclassified Streptomyces]|uniref:hypothetical protein n=1 Tax=unclassified Streptomyces TaxID=2593676 RepID=UPI0001C1CBC9|nr:MULTISPECIES: hypothetical protein [unclassified Streptomyces]AEN09920.1 putative integral membrane protein [Streptomyces sp. SirexAA-E]MYR66472.1 hypothetical protein [Streptomyces sp. SID4939]MYS01734.1 hypothetical protein [Streptomyces sp. SID4940]MYT64224.1 hypothetical protein [Streptomyces sp. SID8357]MYT87037.1 hypothetical protein [Streptomyces sp. SID8360]
MDLDRHRPPAPAPYEGGEGCLTTLVRIPVRIVVLVLILPVRMAWDLLVAGARVLDRVLLRPLGRGLGQVYDHVVAPVGRALGWLALAVLMWPWIGLWRYVLVPVARYGTVVPLTWLYAHALTPAGHGLRRAWRELVVPAGRAVADAVAAVLTVLLVRPAVGLWRGVLRPLGRAAGRLVAYLLVIPAGWVYHRVLTPAGHAVVRSLAALGAGIAAVGRGLVAVAAWLVVTLLVVPVSWAYRRVLAPVGRETAAALGVAWRIAGFVSRAVGRVLAWSARHLVGAPAAWVHRTVCIPVGHFVRDAVLKPAGAAVREAGRAAREALTSARDTLRAARREAWRALVGTPQVTRGRERDGSPARTLGRTTNVPSAAPAPEFSPTADTVVGRG